MMDTMTTCPNGHQTPVANAFCGTCGASIAQTGAMPQPPDSIQGANQQPNEEPPKRPVKRRAVIWVAVGLVLIAGAAGGWFLLRGSNPNPMLDRINAEASCTQLNRNAILLTALGNGTASQLVLQGQATNTELSNLVAGGDKVTISQGLDAVISRELVLGCAQIDASQP
jgi:hypothetical protein